MSAVRRLVERLARGRVVTRRMPPRFGGGGIVVTPDAGLRYLRPNLVDAEPVLLARAEETVSSGATVWDIGANIGLFTLAAAHLAGSTGRVISVEADIVLAELVRRSARMQPASSAPITVIPAAVSDQVGLVEFEIAERGRSMNHLASTAEGSQAGGVRERVSVMSITLDWLLERGGPPAVIKIDVEGAEALVLSAASAVLAVARPVLLCEVTPDNQAEVTRLLRSQGYTLFDADAEPHDRQALATAAWNTLARPG